MESTLNTVRFKPYFIRGLVQSPMLCLELDRRPTAGLAGRFSQLATKLFLMSTGSRQSGPVGLFPVLPILAERHSNHEE